MPTSVQIPYLPVKNARDEIAWRPILPLTLTHQGKSLQISALVETGADVNVLPYRVGLDLGMVWDSAGRNLELSGNLANYEARGVILRATIGQFLPIRLAFAWTHAENIPLLLGQMNFLIEFNVCFYSFRRFFEIHPHNEE